MNQRSHWIRAPELARGGPPWRSGDVADAFVAVDVTWRLGPTLYIPRKLAIQAGRFMGHPAQVFGDSWRFSMVENHDFFQGKHKTIIVHGKFPGFEWCFSNTSNGKKSYKFRSRKLGFQCSLKWENHICKRRIVPPCFAVPVRVFVAGHHESFRTSGSRQTRNGVYRTQQKMRWYTRFLVILGYH